MKNRNLIINAVELVEDGNWNQSNYYELKMSGMFENIPFSIYILSRGQCGEYLTAELEGLGWMSRDSYYDEGVTEDWNISSNFSSLINEFLKFVDEVDERPYRWA